MSFGWTIGIVGVERNEGGGHSIQTQQQTSKVIEKTQTTADSR